MQLYLPIADLPVNVFLVLAMGPPAALLFGSFAWLGIVEWRHRRRHDYSY